MLLRGLAASAALVCLAFATGAMADENGTVGGAIAGGVGGAVVGGPVGAVVGGVGGAVIGNSITSHGHRYYRHRHYYHHHN